MDWAFVQFESTVCQSSLGRFAVIPPFARNIEVIEIRNVGLDIDEWCAIQHVYLRHHEPILFHTKKPNGRETKMVGRAGDRVAKTPRSWLSRYGRTISCVLEARSRK